MTEWEYNIIDKKTKKKIDFEFGQNEKEAAERAMKRGLTNFKLTYAKTSKYNKEGKRLNLIDLLNNRF